MLTDSDYREIRAQILDAKHPLFLYHDDADGLTSFLLLYRLINRGTGIMVKASPKIDDRFVKAAKNPSIDKIFVTDIAKVEQSFVDKVNKPIIWIDHHQPLKVENVKYFNPRVSNKADNYPASYLCYKVSNRSEDLWIAMVGIVGDWSLPEFAGEFAARYPDLWGSKIKKPDDAMFETRLGTLIKVFSFILKGPLTDGLRCAKILTRIQDPYEILDQKSDAGKYLFEKYKKVNNGYERILSDAKKSVDMNSKFMVYIYKDDQSFSSEISNELLHFNPDKVIIVGREREGEVRMSLRGSGNNIILPNLKKALERVNGYGGGHEYACGAAVKVEHFQGFLTKFKEQFRQVSKDLV